MCPVHHEPKVSNKSSKSYNKVQIKVEENGKTKTSKGQNQSSGFGEKQIWKSGSVHDQNTSGTFERSRVQFKIGDNTITKNSSSKRKNIVIPTLVEKIETAVMEKFESDTKKVAKIKVFQLSGTIMTRLNKSKPFLKKIEENLKSGIF